MHENNEVIGAFIILTRRKLSAVRRRLSTAEKSKNMPLLYLLPHEFVQVAFQGKE